GHYGTQGVPSVNNTPPAMYQAAQWTDRQGNFWIFGGLGQDSVYGLKEQSALWKYDITANTWTWVNGPDTGLAPAAYGTLGVPSPNNIPGPRAWGCASWTDTVGNLWLFGGAGYASLSTFGDLNDLWRYNIANNEWTWMSGADTATQPGNYGNLYQPSDSAVPPARSEANTAWIDKNNNLWLFGGLTDSAGYALGSFSDIWRYNIATGQWTWMGGGKWLNAPYSYGTLDAESANNQPPARSSYTHWTDSNYLYLTGGVNYKTYGGAYQFFYSYNDVWRFNLNTNYWTWIGSDSGNITLGQYSNYCTSDSGDKPGGRYEHRSAQLNGCSPLLFMWGGLVGAGALNDLWSFDLGTRKWRWVSGYSSAGYPGNFGAKGVIASSNMPPGLLGACFWGDSNNNLWLWGGWGDNLFHYNTMWKYIPEASCFPAGLPANLGYQISPASLCPGDSALISFSGDSAITISPNNHVTWLDSLHAILKPDTTTEFTVTGYSPCGGYDVRVFTLPVIGATANITSNKTIMCSGDSALICAPSGFAHYSWNNGDTTACIYARAAGNYYVTITENGNCSATSNHVSLAIYPLPPVSVSVNGDTLTGYNAITYQWLLNGLAIANATSAVYIAHTFGSYTLQVTDSNGCLATSTPIVLTGIAGDLAESSISVFPNPTNSGWQLTVGAELIGGLAELYDATGRLVFNSAFRNPHSEILIPGLARGVYELRIMQQGYIFVRKLIKM
ncbi:MAG: Ig-like, group 2, partial [Bacteroidota bacterium]|nr:Ig-like, group 2 [Bacteroidota bacterium]